jgi:hypothetical protein
VLSPFARALAYYGGGGFALALLCAALFLDSPGNVDEGRSARLRRRAMLLASVGVVHPVIAATSLVLAQDAGRGPEPERAAAAVVLAVASLVISLTVMVVAFVVIA